MSKPFVVDERIYMEMKP